MNIIKLINKIKEYTDSNFIKNINNKKFIINYVFFINQELIV